MKKLLQDRKTLYLVLAIVVVSVFTLSIAYAAMSAVLEIHGNSEIVASSWDIHLENVERLSECNIGSATGPSLSMDGNMVMFNVELSEPGECFGFTVDVVNDGTIDAMIDSVVKTPELTPEQAKYIKYEVSYENGESISTKQTLKKGTSTPIRVRVEYRKDISVSDLPSTATELDLSLMFVYVQSDGSGSNIPNNGVKLVNVVSGDGTQVGNEVCIKEECFYVISSTDDTVTMLSKYNLHVGYMVYSDEYFEPINNLNRQSDFSDYSFDSDVRRVGVIGFSEESYWADLGNYELYPTYGYGELAYVYDSNSRIYTYVESYKSYLISLGVAVSDSRLISLDELEKLGCASYGNCDASLEWVYSTSYWSGTGTYEGNVFALMEGDRYLGDSSNSDLYYGVRPVITISRDYL